MIILDKYKDKIKKCTAEYQFVTDDVLKE